MHPIWVARIGAVDPGTAHRILVDRLWPRGIRKDDALWDTWLKELAPSTALRRWYDHDLTRYAAFRERYWNELAANHSTRAWRSGPIALVTASRDLDHSQAPILRDFLQAAGPDR
jgi:uncharacterized protein YeaO (DUF488 family)